MVRLLGLLVPGGKARQDRGYSQVTALEVLDSATIWIERSGYCEVLIVVRRSDLKR